MAVQIQTEIQAQVKMQALVTGEGAPMVLAPGGLTGQVSWEPHVERLASTRKVVSVQLVSTARRC